jgi:hypothetical protein
MSFFTKVFDLLPWIVKGMQVAKAGEDIYETVNSQDKNTSTAKKVVRVFMDGSFVVAQTAEGFAHLPFENNPLKELKVTTCIASGVTDVGRQIAQEGLGLDTVATVAYRAADVGNSVLEDKKCCGQLAKRFKRDGEKIEEFKKRATNVCHACEAAAIVIGNRQVIVNAGTIVTKIVKGIRNRIRSQPVPIPNQQAPQNPQHLAPEDISWIREEVEKLRRLINWEALQEIPVEYNEDPVLRIYICPINNKPIRYVLTLNSDNAPIIYFERSAVQRWIANQPGQAPQGWPQSLPLPISHAYFKPCRHSQKVIDDRLKALAQEANAELPRLLLEANEELQRLRLPLLNL